MGNFFEDAWESVTREVNNLFNGKTLEQFNQQTARIRDELNRGDVGAFIGNQATIASKAFYTPFAATSDILRGDFNNAGKNVVSFAGSVGSAALGPVGYAGSTKTGQSVLENKYVDKFTGGLSGDYAGTIRASNEAMYTGTTSRENIDDTLRFVGKAGVIGGAVVGYNAYQSASSVGGSAVPGYLSTAKDATIGIGAAKSLAKGDVAGAINQIGQISGDYGLPQFPDAPSWVPDLGEIFKDFIGGGSGGSSAPVISNPWVYSGQVDTGAPSAVKAAAVPIALLVVAGILVLSRSK